MTENPGEDLVKPRGHTLEYGSDDLLVVNPPSSFSSCALAVKGNKLQVDQIKLS